MSKTLFTLLCVAALWSPVGSASNEGVLELESIETAEGFATTYRHYDDVVRCESHSHKYNSCYVGRVSRVDLVREHSKTDCVRGRTWGYNDGYIWVDNGCRADFGISRSGGGGETRRVVCTSRDYKFNRCSYGRTIQRARLARQLSRSACDQGRTWGYDRNSIWVDKGCNAEFDVIFR